MAGSRDKLPDWVGRLLCRLGFHDYRLIEVVGAFGAGGQVQKVITDDWRDGRSWLTEA